MIKGTCGDDTKKQVTLAAAVASRLQVIKYSEMQEEEKVKEALLCSIREFYEDLNDRHNGRYTNMDRAAFQAVTSVIAHQAGEGPAVSTSAKERVIGVKHHGVLSSLFFISGRPLHSAFHTISLKLHFLKMHHFPRMGGENEAGFSQTNPATCHRLCRYLQCQIIKPHHAAGAGGIC